MAAALPSLAAGDGRRFPLPCRGGDGGGVSIFLTDRTFLPHRQDNTDPTPGPSPSCVPLVASASKLSSGREGNCRGIIRGSWILFKVDSFIQEV